MWSEYFWYLNNCQIKVKYVMLEVLGGESHIGLCVFC